MAVENIVWKCMLHFAVELTKKFLLTEKLHDIIDKTII